MTFDISTLIGDAIALAALVVSIISLIKSGKTEKIQAEVTAIDAKLKKYELTDAEEGRDACVEARLVSIGKNHRLRIYNKGKAPARQIDYEIEDQSISGFFFKEHVPFPELGYHDHFDETVIIVMGFPAVFDVKVSWVDCENNPHSKVSHVSR